MLNKTVEFSAIWDAMTLMWRHCNMRSLPATPTHLTSSLGFAHPEKSEIGYITLAVIAGTTILVPYPFK